MAKRVQISDDNGSNWYTFPGSKGSLSREGTPLNDTIFGQLFKSDQTGLIGASIETNGVFKGFAGYSAKILKSGSSTSMTDEAMSLVSGKTYQITNTAKRVLDRAVAPTFEDNGGPGAISSSNIESIDFLFGRVTFVSGFTPTGNITINGSYLPMTQVAKGQSFTLTQTANAVDNTTFELAQANGGYRTFQAGLRTVSLAVKGVYAVANAFEALLAARSEAVIEIDPGGNQKSMARGWFKPMMTAQQGDVGELEEADLNFSLSVPDQSSILLAFTWLHASDTTLSQAIRKALDAWDTGDTIDMRYLFDGTNGFSSDSIITDVSLAGGIEAMNDFTVKAQLSGAPTVVP